jgi:NhaP-type Na+/H+ or K+/H+ antiporter
VAALLAGVLPRVLERRPLSGRRNARTSTTRFPGEDLLRATVGFVVLVSVVLHGVAATPVKRLLDRANERTETSEKCHAA